MCSIVAPTSHSRGRLAVRLSLFALVVFAAPVVAGDPVPDVDVVLEQIPGGVIAVLEPGTTADEVFIELPSSAVPDPRLDEVPHGFTAEVVRTKSTTVLRLVRCDRAAAEAAAAAAGRGTEGKGSKQKNARELVSGPPCGGDQAARPRRRVKMSFGQKIGSPLKNVAVEVRREGRQISYHDDLTLDVLPAVSTSGTLSGMVHVPPVVSPGETVEATVADAEALPAGGTWSVGGVVLEEEPLESERPRATAMTISNASKARHDPAMQTIRNLKAFAAAPAGEEGDEITRVVAVYELVPPGSLAQTGLALFAVAPTTGRPCVGGPASSLHLRSATGEAGSAAVVRECFVDSGERPASLPDDAKLYVVGVVGTSPVALGELVGPTLAAAQATAQLGCGALVVESGVAPAPGVRREGDRVTFQLPPGLPVGEGLSLRYDDRWGRPLLDVPAERGPQVVEPGSDREEPAITGGSVVALPGRTTCVCGSFPTRTARLGLLVDGEALGAPAAASSRVVTIEVPPEATPGRRAVSGAREAGFGEDDRWAFDVVRVSGHLDQEELFGGGSTTLRLRVDGTEQPLRFELRNTTPSVITLEGGDAQAVTTSGGASNTVERQVRALSRGAFDIVWELVEAQCPCAADGR